MKCLSDGKYDFNNHISSIKKSDTKSKLITYRFDYTYSTITLRNLFIQHKTTPIRESNDKLTLQYHSFHVYAILMGFPGRLNAKVMSYLSISAYENML